MITSLWLGVVVASARPEVVVEKGRVEAREWELSAAWRTSGFWLTHPGVAAQAESVLWRKARTVDRPDPRRDKRREFERFVYGAVGANWFPGNDVLLLATPGLGWRRTRGRGWYGGGQIGWSFGRFQLAAPTQQLDEAGEVRWKPLSGDWVTGLALGATLGVDTSWWKKPHQAKVWVAPTCHFLFPYNTGLAPTWQVDIGVTLPLDRWAGAR